MALKEVQARLKAVRDELQTLVGKVNTSADENEKMNSLIEEGNGLKARIDQLGRAGEFLDWAGESAGMLPLAAGAGATMEGFKASGTTLVENKDRHLLLTSDGDPFIPEKAWKAICDPEYKRAFKAYLRGGREVLNSNALKALQEGSDESGGFLVPEDVLTRLIAKEPAPQTVASRVTVLNTSRDQMTIPKVNYTDDNKYTSGMRITWAGEIPAAATTHRVTQPVFGQARIQVFTGMMSLPITNDMIEDSSYNIMGWCESKFGETIALLKEDMIVNGTSVNQPSGILINPNAANNPATVNSGAAAALTADGLIDLAFALNEQYDNNAVMVLNKTNSAKAIAKFKDGDGRYLLGSGLADNGLSPVRFNGTRGLDLCGYPALFNAFMPNIAANAYPIIFGDLSGYYMVNRVGFSVQVLRELYAETNQVLLLGRVRFGGLVVEDWRLKIQKVSA